MRRPAAFLASALVVAALLASAASADPINANSEFISFSCDNGLTWTGTGIAQARTSTGHVFTASDPSYANAVFQAVQITVDGQLVKQIPGFTDKGGLVSCTITLVDGEPIGDTIVVTGFFTPASR